MALELFDPEPAVLEDLDLIDPTSSESTVVSTIRGCFIVAWKLGKESELKLMTLCQCQLW